MFAPACLLVYFCLLVYLFSDHFFCFSLLISFVFHLSFICLIRYSSVFCAELDLLGIRLRVGNLRGGGAFSFDNKPRRVEKIRRLDWQNGLIFKKVNPDLRRSASGKLSVPSRGDPQKSLWPCVPGQLTFCSPCEQRQLLLERTNAQWSSSPMQPMKMIVQPGAIVVLDPISKLRVALRGDILETLVQAWHGSVQQVIALAETYGVLLARYMFRKLIMGRTMFF